MTIKFFSIAVCCMCIVLFTSAEYECMGQRMMERRLSRHARENTGPVPDYSRLDYWAASPYKPDCSDSIPAFLKGEQRTSDADVFFIHPTTYTADLKKASWNADVDDSALNEQTDRRPILDQASVFNGSCRVFAPRYRQAHLKAFIAGNSKEAKQALDLAYSDVKRAFQYYLEHDNNGGRSSSPPTVREATMQSGCFRSFSTARRFNGSWSARTFSAGRLRQKVFSLFLSVSLPMPWAASSDGAHSRKDRSPGI